MNYFFSKTFLVGEYCVLEKEKAIIAVTEPKIDLILESKENISQLSNSCSKGPASDLMKLSNRYFDVNVNPNSLGLGTSTAVFLSVLSQIRPDFFVHMTFEEKVKNAFKILDLYLNCESNQLKVKPSGADLLAQYMGLGVWEIDLLNQKILKLDWSYQDIAFKLVRTGLKTATHKHLDQLQELPFAKLRSINSQAIEAYKNKDISFFERVSDFSFSLKELGLQDENTNALQREASCIDGIRAIKGCGAMGSDSLFLIYDKKKRQSVEQFLMKKDLVTYYDSSSSAI